MPDPTFDRDDKHSGGSAGGDEPTSTTTVGEQESEIERLRTDLEEAADRVLRAQAELDNYRKRALREIDEERRYANLPMIRDLLPVVDNIQRAIAAAEKTPDSAGLLEGIKMVANSLVGALARHHCTKIDALHKPFDPAFHEAIAQQPSDQFPPNTVLDVPQDGYVLHDRVVRPAQVVVSTAPSPDEESR